jgi:hypothetical protein
MTASFEALREKHKSFIYKSFAVLCDGQELENLSANESCSCIEISYLFEMGDGPTFSPNLSFYFPKPVPVQRELIQSFAFLIGMVESISYWKCACSKNFVIEPAGLTPEQAAFWKKLFYLGLGEFRYENSIDIASEDFLQFDSRGKALQLNEVKERGNRYILPVSGGKDSRLSLSCFRNSQTPFTTFLLNPLPAALRAIEDEGITLDSTIRVERKIDPALIRLNKEGYLNGHTPFSALLAFLSSFAASLVGAQGIALSNESSANESNVIGENVNHQYSKSYEFEVDFRSLIEQINPELPKYFSFLRPLNEVQISAFLSKDGKALMSFRSCNRGDKLDIWCGECPKCLFVFHMLSAFLPKKKMEKIFGVNLYEDKSLWPLFEGLLSPKKIKPFECVGTRQEVQSILLHHTLRNTEYKEDALIHKAKALLADFKDTPSLSKILGDWNEKHFLPKELSIYLKSRIHEII